jgi:energy-coupling factor transporter transmembrane protein EcfT
MIAAFTTGTIFLSLLLGIACYIAFGLKEEPVPSAMFIFRVILALAAAGFTTVLTGFLEINGKIVDWEFRAAGTLAVFIVIYLVNPPDRLNKLPKPRKPVKVSVPDDRIG